MKLVNFPRRRLAGLAFTLIELLVVIAIIAMLLALGTPAVMHSMKASRLTGAGEKLLGALSEGQQLAYAQNYPVEVRFYTYPGTFPDKNQKHFRSYQFFRITVATKPVTVDGEVRQPGQEIREKTGSLVKLPDNVMISGDPALSPLLAGATVPDEKVHSGVTGASYAAVRFMTDGTCRKVDSTPDASLSVLRFLGLPDSYVTVVEDDGKEYTGATPPKNFYTIQTDPYTGKSRSYRPGF